MLYVVKRVTRGRGGSKMMKKVVTSYVNASLGFNVFHFINLYLVFNFGQIFDKKIPKYYIFIFETHIN